MSSQPPPRALNPDAANILDDSYTPTPLSPEISESISPRRYTRTESIDAMDSSDEEECNRHVNELASIVQEDLDSENDDDEEEEECQACATVLAAVASHHSEAGEVENNPSPHPAAALGLSYLPQRAVEGSAGPSLRMDSRVISAGAGTGKGKGSGVSMSSSEREMRTPWVDERDLRAPWTVDEDAEQIVYDKSEAERELEEEERGDAAVDEEEEAFRNNDLSQCSHLSGQEHAACLRRIHGPGLIAMGPVLKNAHGKNTPGKSKVSGHPQKKPIRDVLLGDSSSTDAQSETGHRPPIHPRPSMPDVTVTSLPSALPPPPIAADAPQSLTMEGLGHRMTVSPPATMDAVVAPDAANGDEADATIDWPSKATGIRGDTAASAQNQGPRRYSGSENQYFPKRQEFPTRAGGKLSRSRPASPFPPALAFRGPSASSPITNTQPCRAMSLDIKPQPATESVRSESKPQRAASMEMKPSRAVDCHLDSDVQHRRRGVHKLVYVRGDAELEEEQEIGGADAASRDATRDIARVCDDDHDASPQGQAESVRGRARKSTHVRGDVTVETEGSHTTSSPATPLLAPLPTPASTSGPISSVTLHGDSAALRSVPASLHDVPASHHNMHKAGDRLRGLPSVSSLPSGLGNSTFTTIATANTRNTANIAASKATDATPATVLIASDRVDAEQRSVADASTDSASHAGPRGESTSSGHTHRKPVEMRFPAPLPRIPSISFSIPSSPALSHTALSPQVGHAMHPALSACLTTCDTVATRTGNSPVAPHHPLPPLAFGSPSFSPEPSPTPMVPTPSMSSPTHVAEHAPGGATQAPYAEVFAGSGMSSRGSGRSGGSGAGGGGSGSGRVRDRVRGVSTVGTCMPPEPRVLSPIAENTVAPPGIPVANSTMDVFTADMPLGQTSPVLSSLSSLSSMAPPPLPSQTYPYSQPYPYPYPYLYSAQPPEQPSMTTMLPLTLPSSLTSTDPSLSLLSSLPPPSSSIPSASSLLHSLLAAQHQLAVQQHTIAAHAAHAQSLQQAVLAWAAQERAEREKERAEREAEREERERERARERKEREAERQQWMQQVQALTDTLRQQQQQRNVPIPALGGARDTDRTCDGPELPLPVRVAVPATTGETATDALIATPVDTSQVDNRNDGPTGPVADATSLLDLTLDVPAAADSAGTAHASTDATAAPKVGHAGPSATITIADGAAARPFPHSPTIHGLTAASTASNLASGRILAEGTSSGTCVAGPTVLSSGVLASPSGTGSAPTGLDSGAVDGVAHGMARGGSSGLLSSSTLPSSMLPSSSGLLSPLPSIQYSSLPRPGVHTLRFAQRPTAVLLIKKPNQPAVSRDMLALCRWLQQYNYTLYAEPAVVDNEPEFASVGLRKIDLRHPGRGVDFAVTLGGDGTVLHYNSLFALTKGPVPPVVSFALGSLGFLTPFPWSKYTDVIEVIHRAHKKPVFVCARMRLLCKVYRAGDRKVDDEASGTASGVTGAPGLTVDTPLPTPVNPNNMGLYRPRVTATPAPTTAITASAPLVSSASGAPPMSTTTMHTTTTTPCIATNLCTGASGATPGTAVCAPCPGVSAHGEADVPVDLSSTVAAADMPSSPGLISRGTLTDVLAHTTAAAHVASAAHWAAMQTVAAHAPHSSVGANTTNANTAANTNINAMSATHPDTTSSFSSSSSSLTHVPAPEFERAPDRCSHAVATRQPLNELVIQRHLSSMALLQLFVDGVLVTTIRADGVIVATPTGSTGYSMSAGGPMMAPSTQALVVTPLCPHNLSFRPVVVCDKTVLRLTVAPEMDPSTPLIASFDGKSPVELFPGDSVQITMSPVRVPSIVFTEFNTEWFRSIKHKLHWNVSALDKERRKDRER